MKKEYVGSVKIIPLGGLDKIGMNITAIQYDDSIIVVDCGLAFPEEEMLGIDLVIPDVTYLKENADKVKGFVITHGHEDHIGSIPYVLKEVNAPIYATKLTMGLIDSKLKEHGMQRQVKRKVVRYGQSINLGDFRVEFIRTNHSIADAAALAIFSPAGVIIHTGDFKVDYTPVYGEPIDLQRMGELGKKGVLALMCDSTNALRPGFTMSERTVGATFDKIFTDNKNSRLIIATFASNVDRVQQIINSAVKYGRKVCVEGRSMVNIIEVAENLDYLKIPEGTLIDTEEMKNYTPEQIVLITTGSQGESMAALSRMAASLHRKVSIQPGDCVVFSSTPIPGNEKSVAKVINELGMKGAKVILLSHLGKVKNDLDRKSNSLYPVAVALSRYLNKDVKFSPDTRGYRLEKMIDELNNGDVLLVENTRFEDICGKKESNCDEELSKYWASLGDIFIEDAYGSCHRKHASVTGIPKYLPSGIGFLIENELNKIDMVLNSDTHPFIVVMGGKKVDDKIVLIEKLLEKCDKLLVGGAMSFTFLKAMGYNVGKSIVSDEHIPFCKKMLEKYSNKIVLPEDFITEKDDVLGNTMIEHFEDDDIGYDIGSKTVNKFKKILSTAKRVILNGPMGMFEEGRFSNGTYLIMKQLSEIKAKTIVGGGDTAAAVNKLGFEKKFYHVSTGGGATMKYLEDGKLIGIEVIDDEKK